MSREMFVVFAVRKYRFISEKNKGELLVLVENAPGHPIFPLYGQMRHL